MTRGHSSPGSLYNAKVLSSKVPASSKAQYAVLDYGYKCSEKSFGNFQVTIATSTPNPASRVPGKTWRVDVVVMDC